MKQTTDTQHTQDSTLERAAENHWNGMRKTPDSGDDPDWLAELDDDLMDEHLMNKKHAVSIDALNPLAEEAESANALLKELEEIQVWLDDEDDNGVVDQSAEPPVLESQDDIIPAHGGTAVPQDASTRTTNNISHASAPVEREEQENSIAPSDRLDLSHLGQTTDLRNKNQPSQANSDFLSTDTGPHDNHTFEAEHVIVSGDNDPDDEQSSPENKIIERLAGTDGTEHGSTKQFPQTNSEVGGVVEGGLKPSAESNLPALGQNESESFSSVDSDRSDDSGQHLENDLLNDSTEHSFESAEMLTSDNQDTANTEDWTADGKKDRSSEGPNITDKDLKNELPEAPRAGADNSLVMPAALLPKIKANAGADNPFLPAAIRHKLQQQNHATMNELNSLGDRLKKASSSAAATQSAKLVEPKAMSADLNDLAIEKLIRRHVTNFEIELRRLLKKNKDN